MHKREIGYMRLFVSSWSSAFFDHPFIKERLALAENAIANGTQTVTSAALQLMDDYDRFQRSTDRP
ncbi:hypothetical protein GCM10020331_041510 [Ectobacillus funiculus]